MHPLSPRTERRVRCCVCARYISIPSATTPDPQCPEMLALPLGVRVGLVRDEPHATATMIFTCDEACLEQLLAKGLLQ